MSVRAQVQNNSNVFGGDFTVQDTNDSNAVVFSGNLGPKEKSDVELTKSGNYGGLRYKREDQTIWTNVSLVSEGDVVSMN